MITMFKHLIMKFRWRTSQSMCALIFGFVQTAIVRDETEWKDSSGINMLSPEKNKYPNTFLYYH